MESVDEKELEEATQIVKDSILFISENATTREELKTAETLEAMAKDGKIIIGDTSRDIGRTVYGYCRSGYDPMSGEDNCYIVLDYNMILAYGEAETIDTTIHEAYHAAHYFAGHKNDSVEEETRAWNMGLEMSNRYREQVGEYIARTEPYTQSEIQDIGYSRTLGEGVFTEIKVFVV